MNKKSLYGLMLIVSCIVSGIILYKVNDYTDSTFRIWPLYITRFLLFAYLGGILGVFSNLNYNPKNGVKMNKFALGIGVGLLVYSSFGYVLLYTLINHELITVFTVRLPIEFMQVASGFFIVSAFENKVEKVTM